MFGEKFSESVLDSLVTPHSHSFNIDFCIESLGLEKDGSSICRLCPHDEETIIHLFFHCNHLKQLWGSISTWIKMKIGLLINFKIQDIILGYLQKDVNYDVTNLLVMCTKKYIF